jgi:hypothetical protein
MRWALLPFCVRAAKGERYIDYALDADGFARRALSMLLGKSFRDFRTAALSKGVTPMMIGRTISDDFQGAPEGASYPWRRWRKKRICGRPALPGVMISRRRWRGIGQD